MHSKLQWRYFFALLVPSVVILLLGVWLSVYLHSRSLHAMQRDVELSNRRAVESIATSIDMLLDYGSLSAIDLSFQVDMMQNSNAQQVSMYNSAVDQLIFMQLNAESLLNTVVDRSYIFFFDENRVITQSSTRTQADAFYEAYFQVNDGDFSSFRHALTQRYYAGEVLPDTRIGYMGTAYQKWLLVQSIPADPMQTPRGAIIYALDESVLAQRLSDGIADGDSVCMLIAHEGATIISQGNRLHWEDALISDLQQRLSPDAHGIHYLSLMDRQEYLVTVAPCAIGHVVAAQPLNTVFLHMNEYSTSILLLMLGMILLAVMVALLFTRRNTNAMKRVIHTIAPEHQSENATNVFSYMEEAILSVQQKEAILAAHAKHQRTVLQDIFLKHLLRGEWQTESDILQEQDQSGVNVEAKAYVVILIHFFKLSKVDGALAFLKTLMNKEFGEEHVFLVRMRDANIACLLLAEEPDLRESIEAVADEFSRDWEAAILVSGTVTALTDVPQAYRQVSMMSRMALPNQEALQWYSELFQDDVLYNFEYSVYTETGLRNNIAAGNEQGIQNILSSLYAKSLENSVYSDHVLRFFAYDLYRLVNHVGVGGSAADRKEHAYRLRRMLDSVMEDPKRFDAYFDEVKNYCLQMCRQNQSRRLSSTDDLLGRITGYIDAHFADTNLSVAGIAEALDMSSKYLSLFFKEQTHGKISAYIENKRIAHACNLLDTTDRTINDIALASGYALTHTFRVAFKKVQGVTPLEWKKSRKP